MPTCVLALADEGVRNVKYRVAAPPTTVAAPTMSVTRASVRTLVRASFTSSCVTG